MADSSYEKGLSELSKMKVADLKADLKQRGLPTTGNKTELMERLQLAIHGDSTLSLDETTDEILDEDAVLGVCKDTAYSLSISVEDQQVLLSQDEEIEEFPSKPDSQEVGEKRKLSTESNTGSIKKIVLNRNTIIEEIKVDEAKSEEGAEKIDDATQPEKKVIKLSELGVKERLEMRAKKFGMPLSESAKKEARSARFNANNGNSTSSASVKTPVHVSYEVLKKRSERFGTSASSIMEKAERDARIEKRKARFGEVKPIEKVFHNRVKIVK